MRKLLNDELNRLTVEEYRGSSKLPVRIILDNIRSQNNIGSLFRTVDAFRMEGIVLCGITATPPHREIHKTALGATESVQWEYQEHTVKALQELKANGYQILVAEQTEGAIPLQNLNLSENQSFAVVFGHEIRGVQQDVVDLADQCIEIPQFGTKHSLNISVAAGIFLWELSNKLPFPNQKS